MNEEPRLYGSMSCDYTMGTRWVAESVLGRTSSRCMAILFGRSLCLIEKIISELSFQSPFPRNSPAPINLTLLLLQPHVLSPKPAAVDLPGENLQVLGF